MITNFASAALWVDDFSAAINFYQSILGLELTTRPGEAPQFKIGDSLLVLVKGKLAPAAGAFPPDFPLLAFEVDDLDAAMKQLIEAGAPTPPTIEQRRDSRWLKISDPAGNLIELVEIKR